MIPAFAKPGYQMPQGLRDAIVGVSLCGFMGLLWLGVPLPGIAPALAVLPLIMIYAVPRVFLIALLFMVFSFFRIHEVFPQLMPFRFPLLTALGTIVALAWGLSFQKLKPQWDRIYTPFIIFFILVTIGIATASNVQNSFAYWKDTYVKIAIMVFALSWSIHSKREIAWIQRAVIYSGMIVATVTLYNKAMGIGLVEGTRVTIGRNIGSMLGDPNDLSLVLLFSIGSCLGAAMTKGLPKFDRVVGLLAYCLLVVAIVATQSRGGLLGVAGVTGVFAAQKIKSKMLLGSIGAIALIALHTVAGISDRQSGGAHEEGIDKSAMGRIHAWNAAFKMALYNPLTGVGVDNFLFNYFTYSDYWSGKNHAVHSTWFGVMGETGFLGFIVFVWMMVEIFRVVYRYRRQLTADPNSDPILTAGATGLFGGLVGFCVSGTFLTQGFTWPIYIILAITIGLRRVIEQQNAATAQNDAQNETSCSSAKVIPTTQGLKP